MEDINKNINFLPDVEQKEYHSKQAKPQKSINQNTPVYLFSVSASPDAVSVNSLCITLYKPVMAFALYDYFILTSKQAVEVLKQYDKTLYINKKALCVSKATAKAYEKIGGSVLDVGRGYGDNLVEKIKSYPKATQWLYIRAEVVASDFSSVCRDSGYSIDEVVGYKSECSKEILEIQIQKGSIVIFTSPSSVKCYMQTHIFERDDTVIVIGKTTQKALPDGVKSILSPQTTIQSCIEIAMQLKEDFSKN